ncbi:glycerophosphodiester phosphodiesterase family protein [Hirschia maritima]|uniref:glycerophosphodiester phosphodiesterase family protein n=1 Tax=Hirschia maritima TaxID=1121961 RepID=UPI00039D549E|nr:glycerophosphodiester phosphodiesterase family protein [Hirschia maritima]
MKKILFCGSLILASSCQNNTMKTHPIKETQPIIIAHRGASGYLPEHTLEAYKLGIEMGADYIEPDLVLTKDGVFVARHENEISTTTNVADLAQFKDRHTTKTIEGVEHTGWFTEDFTFEELKTLKAKERLPKIRPDNAKHDNKFDIVRLEEIILFAREQSKIHGRNIGLYIELKHPKYFNEISLPMEDRFLSVLSENGLNSKDADLPVYIQCFWPEPLIYMKGKTIHPQIFLMYSEAPDQSVLESVGVKNWEESYTIEGFEKISEFADGVGPWTGLVFPEGKSNQRQNTSEFIENAHKAGLKVHPWTLRAENVHLPVAYRSSADADNSVSTQGDLSAFTTDLIKAGVDGVFTDHPDIAVSARKKAAK